MSPLILFDENVHPDFSVTAREERAFFSDGMERISSWNYLQNVGHVLPAKVKPSKGSEVEDD
jgi:hypothetical protein